VIYLVKTDQLQRTEVATTTHEVTAIPTSPGVYAARKEKETFRTLGGDGLAGVNTPPDGRPDAQRSAD
jgi:hypothetical protein